MNPMNATTKLRHLGYFVHLEGGTLKYLYRGKNGPPKEKVAPLIKILKVHKEEILSDPHFHIHMVLGEINERHEPGTLMWAKQERVQEWQKALTLEGEINKAALLGDVEALKEVLTEYMNLMLSMIGEFTSSKAKRRKEKRRERKRGEEEEESRLACEKSLVRG